MRRLLALALGFVLLIPSAVAQITGTDACSTQIIAAMAREQRVYRSVLFGQAPASELPEGSVSFDLDFHAWTKVSRNTWRTMTGAYVQTTWTDRVMDEQAEFPVRRGLFAVRSTPTSDLLHPALQSYRALTCRLRAVCRRAEQSSKLEADQHDPFIVQPEGCIEFMAEPLSACTKESQYTVESVSCDTAVDNVLDSEGELLKLAIAYDAAYRTLLQFAGIFEGFVSDLSFSIMSPLYQTLRMVGALSNLPCFLSQCDE